MRNIRTRYKWWNSVAIIWLLLPAAVSATDSAGLSTGQTLYVPAYSHIYSGNKESPFLLTITLSIRNIDPHHAITLQQVDYFETQGKKVKAFIDAPIQLRPLESVRYVIPEKDTRGGSGANFIVKWTANRAVNAPIAEAIMIGTQTQQGVSFTSRGRIIVTPTP
ncbi:MAG: hypothetical protein CSA22_09715 [Deltaproteobacteria bacterium]|nr:MAG: hypothetical protein CSA22_09715 [Deltaproteobacteria bacterium]